MNSKCTVVANLDHQYGLDNTEYVLANDNSNNNGFLAQDIYHSFHQLGGITVEISTDYLLERIFKKLYIGK